MDEHGLDDKAKHAQLVKLMAQKTLIFVMEQLARSDEQSSQSGPEAASENTNDLSSAALPITLPPLPICRHIPKKVCLELFPMQQLAMGPPSFFK